MLRKSLAFILSASVMALGVSACGTNTKSPKAKRTALPVQFTAAPTKDFFTSEEPIVVKLTYKNIGSKDLILPNESEWTAEVKNSKGEIMAPTREGARVLREIKSNERALVSSGTHHASIIPPGEDGSFYIFLNSRYDMTEEGIYWVTITELWTNNHPPLRFTSNVLRVTNKGLNRIGLHDGFGNNGGKADTKSE